MKKRMISICLLGLAVQISVSESAAAQSAQAAGSQQPPLMDRQNEIALALSACPASATSKAAVYVLEKSGYVKVRDSQNGFTAIVRHSQPNNQEPQCMDAEGTRTFLPRYLKVPSYALRGRAAKKLSASLPTPSLRASSSHRHGPASTICCRRKA